MDLREIGAALRRGIRWIIGAGLLGFVLALVVTWSLEARYKAESTVLVRSGNGTPSFSSRLGGLVGAFPGTFQSDLSTELQLLTSRVLIAGVVDSLGLQARILEPGKLSSRAVVAAAAYPAVLPRTVYKFERDGSAYEVIGRGASGRAIPGVPYRLGRATITLRRSGLPDAFTVEVMSLEDAIDAVQENLTAAHAGGDVIQLTFRAGDPRTVAAVPNMLVAEYLQRRRTTDRGVNQRRFEFLTKQADSIAGELAIAEASLRQHQERSGGIDPEAAGNAGFGRMVSLRAELETIEVEARALEQILARSDAGEISARQLAAYPTFLRNGAINSLLSRLLELDTRRVELLERRTERDPDVVAISKTIDSLEAQLVALSRAYRTGLLRQRETLRSELGQYREEIATIPGQTQQSTRRRRDVARLSETLLALQGQMVEARLAAISEGGEVRPIDRAVVPRGPYFPNPVLNSVGGLLAGLFFGMIGAVVAGQLRRRVYEPWEAELATGLPAARFDPRLPLSFPLPDRVQTILLLPVQLSGEASRVAEHMAATAALRGADVVLTDLVRADEHRPVTGNGTVVHKSEKLSDATGLVPAAVTGDGYSVYRRNGASALEIRSTVAELERRFSLVIAALPGIEDPLTASLLAPERAALVVVRGGVTRSELQEAVAVVERMGVPTAGVVIAKPAEDGRDRS